MNYREIINTGTLLLKDYCIPTPEIDAEILLTICLNKSREQILLNSEQDLNQYQINNYYELISRRKKDNLSHL